MRGGHWVNPKDVGFPVGNEQQRVAGLRREEVAILAGISTEYYLRLEQGREMHPSDQVLDALARALLLDKVASSYLLDLAQRPSPAPTEEADVVQEGVQSRKGRMLLTSQSAGFGRSQVC